MKFVVLNKDGLVLLNSLHTYDFESIKSFSEPSVKVKCQLEGCYKRKGIINNSNGLIYAETKHKELVKNNRLFKSQLKIAGEVLNQFLNLVNEIRETNDRIVRRLLHNVIRLNGGNLQRLYSVFPESALTGKLESQMETISDIVKNNNTEVSKLIFRLIKDSLFIRTEFSAFKALISTTEKVEKKKYSIRKVLLNALHIFFYEFKQNNVYVYVENYNQSIFLNYPSMTAALVHIIDNAAKYICPDTQLNIEFHDSPNYVDLTFNMTSLKITDDDFENIHIEGYSGELPRQLEIAGDGIGMSVIPTLLKLNSATLKIFRNVDQSKSKLLDSIEYENNIINVRIKK